MKILTRSPTLLATNPRSASHVETDCPAFGSRRNSSRRGLSGSTRFRFQLLTYRYTPLRDILKLFVCWRLLCSPWHPCTSSVSVGTLRPEQYTKHSSPYQLLTVSHSKLEYDRSGNSLLRGLDGHLRPLNCGTPAGGVSFAPAVKLI